MSFQPILPLGGYTGWTFLTRTREAQQAAHDASPVLKRETDYFRENISKVETAADLVKDPVLMKVALGAFGLENDLPNKAFIEKVLAEGSIDDEAFANKLADKRYLDMAVAFGFDLGVPSTQISTFADDMIADYQSRQFEVAVGNQNQDFRVALSSEGDLQEIVGKDTGVDTKWFSIMGNPPVRKLLDVALGMPSSFATLDIDRQLEVYKERALATFGSDDPGQFTDPDKQEDLVRLYLLRSQVQNFNSQVSAGQNALVLLQSAGF